MSPCKILIVFWVTLLGTVALAADTSIYRNPFEDVPKYVQAQVEDYGEYWTTPLRWNQDEWTTVWSFIGITGALLLVDYPVHHGTNVESLNGVNAYLDPAYQMGHWPNVAKAVPSLFVLGWVLGDTKLQHANYLAARSFGAEILVVQGLKNLTYRDNTQGDPFLFKSPRWEFPSYGAFPSGHAAISWAVLTSYAIAYEEDPPIPFICYTLATLSSIALITTRTHWISDIPAGAAIGYYTAQFSAHTEKRRFDRDTHRPTTTVIPFLTDEGGPGLAYQLQF